MKYDKLTRYYVATSGNLYLLPHGTVCLYDEVVTVVKELKRALWLARAKTALCEMRLFVKESVEPDATGEDAAFAERMALKWSTVELKCRKKAKEYV